MWPRGAKDPGFQSALEPLRHPGQGPGASLPLRSPRSPLFPVSSPQAALAQPWTERRSPPLLQLPTTASLLPGFYNMGFWEHFHLNKKVSAAKNLEFKPWKHRLGIKSTLLSNRSWFLSPFCLLGARTHQSPGIISATL